jgi:fatty acid CoA ligase FadD28
MSGGQLFIVGRIKDLLIVRGRNHAPDDIEATISEISRGRVAAIGVTIDGEEQLVAVVEARTGGSPAEVADALAALANTITAAVSTAHGLTVADLVLVAPGSIPITTSGKVRRAACLEQYQRNGFSRLAVRRDG